MAAKVVMGSKMVLLCLPLARGAASQFLAFARGSG
jgi:hypothetical protein